MQVFAGGGTAVRQRMALKIHLANVIKNYLPVEKITIEEDHFGNNDRVIKLHLAKVTVAIHCRSIVDLKLWPHVNYVPKKGRCFGRLNKHAHI